MSLPDEYVRAQERIINGFIEGKFDRREWPKHLINGIELGMLFDENEKLLDENKRLKKVVNTIIDSVVEYGENENKDVEVEKAYEKLFKVL